MLAAVFMMQPVGQLCAALAGFIALHIVDTKFGLRELVKQDPDGARMAVDTIWRGVVGFGAVPAVVAIFFRFLLPDPGRYTLEVKDDIDRAMEDTAKRRQPWWLLWRKTTPRQDAEQSKSQEETTTEDADPTRGTDTSHMQTRKQSWQDVKQYLWHEGNGAVLIGTSATWFLLDVAFYGLGINSPYTLSMVWANSKSAPQNIPPEVVPWNSNPTRPDDTIYDILSDNAKRLILTSTLASLAGSILLLFIINRFQRKLLLKWSFLVLFFFLLATALSIRFNFGERLWFVTLIFYICCQFLFNAGEYGQSRSYV